MLVLVQGANVSRNYYEWLNDFYIGAFKMVLLFPSRANNDYK